MSSQTGCTIAPLFIVEAFNSSLSRIEIQKAHINTGSCCDGFLPNENEVMRFSEFCPPVQQCKSILKNTLYSPSSEKQNVHYFGC